MKKEIQAKDIPDKSILDFLRSLNGTWACLQPGFNNSISNAEGCEDIPIKVLQAKMGSLIRRGFVDGCPCGCRGDFRLVETSEQTNKQIVKYEIPQQTEETCKKVFM